MAFNILILGENYLKDEVQHLFSRDVSEVRFTATLTGYLDWIEDDRPDLVVLNFDAPRLKPFKVLSELFVASDDMNVIVLAENPSVEDSVKCVKMGAQEVIPFPTNKKKCEEVLKKYYSHWQQESQSLEFSHQQQEQFGPQAIIGESSQIKRVVKVVEKIAKRKWVTVLLTGETGTGKEVIARAIHFCNPNAKPGSFVEVNCTALPENLLEAELFGYEKGAFTDAKTRKIGLFEMANGGTLFLDEIGDMSMAMQVKLLKAIEEKRFRRLGGTSDIHVKTRIVAGTNADLQKRVEEGAFRQDLYYRLNVVNIELPPLRERGEDTELLANHFVKKFCHEYEMPARQFSPQAMEVLSGYDWPGNVRELKHTVERVVLLNDEPLISAEEVLSALGIKEEPQAPKQKKNWYGHVIEIPQNGMSLKDGERMLIEGILNITKWNKTKASKILGISRPRLNRKIDEYQIGWVNSH